MKNLVVLGSTGSIGVSTLKVCKDLSKEIRVIGLAANEKADLLIQQTLSTGAKCISISRENKYKDVRQAVPREVQVLSGSRGLVELATMPEADIVLIAIVGTKGLEPALAAIRAGKDIAVASKEILVMAGEIVMREAKINNVKVLPVDSEHSAIWQCLDGKPGEQIRKLVLTASGGPFRNTNAEDLAKVTIDQALQHPSWKMGRKITIDSATMMNKGLEMIEARWLFDMPIEKIEVIIHPQSVIHSMVEFIDGSVLAQLSEPDMRLPIQFALTYPNRLTNSLRPTDFARIGTLTFEYPDRKKFPSLDLARDAGTESGTMPAVFNAANEIAVEKFIASQCQFCDIWRIVEKVMRRHSKVASPTLDDILAADEWARNESMRSH